MNDTFDKRRYYYDWPVATEGLQLTSGRVSRLYRFVMGRDSSPEPMSDGEIAALGDPFVGALTTSTEPLLTARKVVAAIDLLGFERESFVASDGGQIRWGEDSAHLARQTRLVVAWIESGVLQVLLATGTALDDPTDTFLQVIGWDENHRQFNFLDRRQGTWVWAGRSEDALHAPTRGLGPFDSHINGGLVMKELRAPWLHWSSMAAFQLPGIAPDSPFRTEPLFTGRIGAEVLERRGTNRDTTMDSIPAG